MVSEVQETNNLAMLDKDKIIIVVYLNTGCIDMEDVNEFCYEATKFLNRIFDDSVLKLVVPVREGETRVECINPILLTEDEYKKTMKTVENLTEKVNKALEDLIEDLKK